MNPTMVSETMDSLEATCREIYGNGVEFSRLERNGRQVLQMVRPGENEPGIQVAWLQPNLPVIHATKPLKTEAMQLVQNAFDKCFPDADTVAGTVKDCMDTFNKT